jgi:GLPGLI family protein
MFKRLIVTVLFSTIPLVCFSQIEVRYDVEYIINEKLKETLELKQSCSDMFAMHIKALENFEGVLIACDNKSYFTVENRGMDLKPTDYMSIAYFDLVSWITTATKAENIQRRNFQRVEADYNKEPWVFINEARVIAGYVCQKAYKKLKYENQPELDQLLVVWFTTDVAVTSGFTDATGIPGLILFYANNEYKYTAKEVATLKKCKIDLPEMKTKTFTQSNKEAAARMEERRNRKR